VQAYGHGNYQAEAQAIGEGYRDKLSKPGEGYLYKSHLPDEEIARMLDWDKPLSEQTEYVKNALRPFTDKYDPSLIQSKTGEDLYSMLYRKANTGEIPTKSIAPPAMPDTTGWTTKQFGRDTLVYDADKNMVGSADTHRVTSDQQAFEAAWLNSPQASVLSELQHRMGNDQAVSEYLAKLAIPGNKYLDAASREAGEGTRNFVVFDPSASKLNILERNGQAMSPESQAIARYREIKGPKSVVRMEAALRTAGVPLPKDEPVAYIQRLVDQAHRRN
jgi:hypothetical protein